MRRYTVHTPAGPLTIAAERVTVEDGALVVYGHHADAERECIVAAFSPIGWLRCELAHD